MACGPFGENVVGGRGLNPPVRQRQVREQVWREEPSGAEPVSRNRIRFATATVVSGRLACAPVVVRALTSVLMRLLPIP